MTDAQRASDLRFLFDAFRDLNAEKYTKVNQKLPLTELLSWLRGLHSATLHQYRTTAENPDKKYTEISSYFNSQWGTPVELLLHAGEEKLDDTATALILFISHHISPYPQGSQLASSGMNIKRVYADSKEHLSGLLDTIYYHAECVSDEVAAGVIDGNIFSAPQQTQDALIALLSVADYLVQQDIALHYMLTPRDHDKEPPHKRYLSVDGDGSLWLSNGELVRYILQRPQDAKAIAELVAERRTDDVEAVKAVMENQTVALSSGAL